MTFFQKFSFHSHLPNSKFSKDSSPVLGHASEASRKILVYERKWAKESLSISLEKLFGA